MIDAAMASKWLPEGCKQSGHRTLIQFLISMFCSGQVVKALRLQNRLSRGFESHPEFILFYFFGCNLFLNNTVIKELIPGSSGHISLSSLSSNLFDV